MLFLDNSCCARLKGASVFSLRKQPLSPRGRRDTRYTREGYLGVALSVGYRRTISKRWAVYSSPPYSRRMPTFIRAQPVSTP